MCYACSHYLADNEVALCTVCRHNLPITNFHFNDDNAIATVLAGRAKIENGTALFRFEKKGIVQQLIHNLKYRGQEAIGITLGDWLGNELALIESYVSIDAVLPVPLHKKRQRKRGYNQVSAFAKRIALALQAEYLEGVLVKTVDTSSQTIKKRFARGAASSKHFALKNEHLIYNKHVLLVDDIITTGATMEACITTLNNAKDIKISIATIAIA